MEMINLFLANGFFLSAILLILIIIVHTKKDKLSKKKNNAKVRKDIKRIKDQI